MIGAAFTSHINRNPSAELTRTETEKCLMAFLIGNMVTPNGDDLTMTFDSKKYPYGTCTIYLVSGCSVDESDPQDPIFRHYDNLIYRDDAYGVYKTVDLNRFLQSRDFNDMFHPWMEEFFTLKGIKVVDYRATTRTDARKKQRLCKSTMKRGWVARWKNDGDKIKESVYI